jgi:transcriptional repressor NrdR
MICPRCDSERLKVLDSRDAAGKRAVRRRRECTACSYRFTTYERIERPRLIVVKKDKTREPYRREKVEEGVWRALEKRPVTQEQVEELLDGIEEELVAHSREEVMSTHIGELVMNQLRDLDEVAYIRFASVYRSFTDVASFKRELNELKK